MDPTARMDKDDKLGRSIAEYGQLRRYAARDQASDQCPFGGHQDVPLVRDSQLAEPGLPSLVPHELLRTLRQFGHYGRRRSLSFPVSQRGLVDGVVVLAALQDVQEVQPAFGVTALEVRK